MLDGPKLEMWGTQEQRDDVGLLLDVLPLKALPAFDRLLRSLTIAAQTEQLNADMEVPLIRLRVDERNDAHVRVSVFAGAEGQGGHAGQLCFSVEEYPVFERALAAQAPDLKAEVERWVLRNAELLQWVSERDTEIRKLRASLAAAEGRVEQATQALEAGSDLMEVADAALKQAEAREQALREAWHIEHVYQVPAGAHYVALGYGQYEKFASACATCRALAKTGEPQ